jgi:hypothetical protein
MIWLLVGLGWAGCLTFFIALCVAAADGDRMAERLNDDLDLKVFLADGSQNPPAERRR